jgi:hypothetical protein
MDKQRLQRKKEELVKQWDLFTEKLSRLERTKILATDPGEKFRLEQEVVDLQAERQQIEEQLNDLEARLLSKKEDVSSTLTEIEEKQEAVIKDESDHEKQQEADEKTNFWQEVVNIRIVKYMAILFIGIIIGSFLYQEFWVKCEDFILSKNKTFYFDDGDPSGWKPFGMGQLDDWVYFIKTGEIEVVEKKTGIRGVFLKYSLDLESPGKDNYKKRNAVYYLVDAEVKGILANIFYEPEEEYETEKILAGFIFLYETGGKSLWKQSWMIQLKPKEWNTIAWSLYGPVWWEETSDKRLEHWEAFEGLWEFEGVNLHPGWRFANKQKIDKIGIQFYVNTEKGPKQFKGAAYIDNIAIIY